MKKILHHYILAIALFLSPLALNAQWHKILPAYGGNVGNDGAASFCIGDKGYLVAGSSTKQVFKYDTASKRWSFLTNIPASMGQAFAMSFVIGNKAYIVGGDSSGVPIASVWEFNPTSTPPQWTRKKDFPGGRRDGGFGFALNNYGYVGAGFDGAAIYNDIWKYNPSDDSWMELSFALPIDGLMFPSSFVVENKAYILTGALPPTAVVETAKMWCFDPEQNTITEKAAFGGSSRQASFAFSLGKYGFLGGGQSGYTDTYNDVWMYNTEKNSWSRTTDIPMLGSAWASAFVIGSTAYVGLGAKFVGSSLTGTDDFYTYTLGSSTTDVHDAVTGDDLYNIYPNPSTDITTIKATPSESFHVALYSALGEKMIDQHAKGVVSLSLGHLPSGMYVLTISPEHGAAVSKTLRILH